MDWSEVLKFFYSEANGLAIGRILMVLGAIGAVIIAIAKAVAFYLIHTKKEKLELTLAEPINLVMPAEEAQKPFNLEQPAFEITLDEYEARQGELDEVKARLREPDKALEDYKETIRELEDRLGNRETKDEQAVQAALDQGNLDQAQEILEKMAAQDDLAIMKAANTAYSLGQIAEEKVDWPAAAEHYQKAANLSSSYANLIKAHEFTHWAGD